MNIPPDQAKALSVWEYTAILSTWNAQIGGEKETAPLPDASAIDAIFARGAVH